MSELSEIYSALHSGRAAAASLETWVKNADGRDSVRSLQFEIERGFAAYERLQSQLRDGRKHVDPPDDHKITSCQCGAPNAAPPCSYCTRDIDGDAEEETP